MCVKMSGGRKFFCGNGELKMVCFGGVYGARYSTSSTTMQTAHEALLVLREQLPEEARLPLDAWCAAIEASTPLAQLQRESREFLSQILRYRDDDATVAFRLHFQNERIQAI
jgi:hypothetical protein